MIFPTWYSLIVGFLMLGQWGFFIASGNVPEFQTEPIRIIFHLAAEAATAFTLITAGISLLKRRHWASKVGLVAHGMLVYTLIVSPGYFAQKDQWPFVVIFGALLILTVVSTALLFRIEWQ